MNANILSETIKTGRKKSERKAGCPGSQSLDYRY